MAGIVGLPNVGKSTLFNALTATQAAQAANYPFCTIEPNVGRVGVPDTRLDKIAAIGHSAKIIPTQLEFVDIAGLVKGASKGEGLGNQFLGNIRATDAILHVLRCFEDGDVTVEGFGWISGARCPDYFYRADAVRPRGLEKQIENWKKRAKQGDKEALVRAPVMEKAIAALSAGQPARTVKVIDNRKPLLTGCNCSPPNRCCISAMSMRAPLPAATPSRKRLPKWPQPKALLPSSSRRRLNPK